MRPGSLNRSVLLRIVSAIIAIGGLFALLWLAGAWGMRALCIFAVLQGTRELLRILFRPEDSKLIKGLFFVLMFLLFALTSWSLEMSGITFAFVSIAFFSASLWMRDRFDDLTAMSALQSKSVLGFFYLGLLPGFGMQILELSHGQIWFIALLAFVLSGDSLAFFSGMLFGKTPLLPEISPKKTVEGAIGGLLGSLISGYVIALLFPFLPMGQTLTLAACAGLVGQMGDLFESLLKRVANQKDSGSIMPGHGGVLDRIDGVLFAAPIVLIGASLIENGFRLGIE